MRKIIPTLLGLLLLGCSPARHATLWQKETRDALAAEKNGDYELATKHYLEAMRTAKSGMLGNEATAASTYDCGRMLGMQGKFDHAEEAFKQSLALEEPIYGPSGGHAYMRYFELARLYTAWGKHKEAVVAYQKAFPAALKLGFDQKYPKTYKYLLHDYADALDRAGAPPARSQEVRRNAGPKKVEQLEMLIQYYPSAPR